MNLSKNIKELAIGEGIDVIRFTNAEPFKYDLLDSPRHDPHITLPSAQTLIICGVYIGGFEIPDRHDPSIGQFSRLIMSGFYFDIVKPLKSIVSLLKDEGYEAIVCDGYSGDSILPLKLAAVRAGIGWQGKNSLLITKDYGSFVALGGIITNVPLELDDALPEENHCGSCNACKNACPMNALEEPYKLNVNRCMSNLLEGQTLSDELRNAAGNKILECDLCQLVCPWNKRCEKMAVKSNFRWGLKERFNNLNDFFKISNLMKLSEIEFNKYLGYRLVGVNYNIFRRNLIMAMINSNSR